MGRRIIYVIGNGEVKDFYGRVLYLYDDHCLRDINTRFIHYEFHGDNITEFGGRIISSFDGHFFKDICGPIRYEIKDNMIRPFIGVNEYYIDGNLTKVEWMVLLTILYIAK
jgi:hypothetical protein